MSEEVTPTTPATRTAPSSSNPTPLSKKPRKPSRFRQKAPDDSEKNPRRAKYLDMVDDALIVRMAHKTAFGDPVLSHDLAQDARMALVKFRPKRGVKITTGYLVTLAKNAMRDAKEKWENHEIIKPQKSKLKVNERGWIVKEPHVIKDLSYQAFEPPKRGPKVVLIREADGRIRKLGSTRKKKRSSKKSS